MSLILRIKYLEDLEKIFRRARSQVNTVQEWMGFGVILDELGQNLLHMQQELGNALDAERRAAAHPPRKHRKTKRTVVKRRKRRITPKRRRSHRNS